MTCLGSLSEVISVAEQRGLQQILLADESIATDDLRRLIGDCKRFGLSLTLVAPHAELLGPGIQLNRLGELPLLDFAFSDPPRSTMAMKRGIDIVVSAGMLLLLAPLLLVIAIAIKLDSRGPVLFRQVRVGKGGRRFRMLKFRTMVQGADEMKDALRDYNEAKEGLFKIAEDPRVTRMGRFLRITALDELPQLFNIVKGEMSLVGPRPLVIEEDERIEGWHRRRLELMPGMTGPWQILGPARVPLKEMVTLDYLYVANWSLWADVKLLLRTVPHVLGRRGL
jgi:exopolysaccharide biosynthesis polyprenyl glycosylphosphotransferase